MTDWNAVGRGVVAGSAAPLAASWLRALMQPSLRLTVLPNLPQAAWGAVKSFSAAHYATLTSDQLADALEHTTGPEREELEAKLKGIENPWHEAWCVVEREVAVPVAT